MVYAWTSGSGGIGCRAAGSGSWAEDAVARRPATRVNTAITTASTTAIGIWTPLGPAPLASDATGLGQQDYGWVSGRATAVAVDPADATGNTVYIGGAYGGVWKSTNAGLLSPNPASVSW